MKIKNERRYIDLLKFIIYNTENAQASKVRKSLRSYAEQQYASIKILSVNSLEELIKTHGTICLMDYDFYLKNFERLKKWKKKTHICFMFIAKNHYQMIEAVKSNPNDYCLLSPLKTDMLLMLLDYIREKIKSKVIAIKKPKINFQKANMKVFNINLPKSLNGFVNKSQKFLKPNIEVHSLCNMPSLTR